MPGTVRQLSSVHTCALQSPALVPKRLGPALCSRSIKAAWGDGMSLREILSSRITVTVWWEIVPSAH